MDLHIDQSIKLNTSSINRLIKSQFNYSIDVKIKCQTAQTSEFSEMRIVFIIRANHYHYLINRSIHLKFLEFKSSYICLCKDCGCRSFASATNFENL